MEKVKAISKGCLEELKLDYVVAIRSNHGVWMPSHQRVRYNKKPLADIPNTGLGILLAEHHHWDFKTGWKNLLNNLRLIVQPFVASQLMQFWLKVFPIPELFVGLNRLIAFMNRFPGAIPLAHAPADFHFSSA